MFAYYLKLKHYLLIKILFAINICHCQFYNNVNQIFYANSTAVNFLRFRDFEPRYTLKTDNSYRLLENKRRPRGFQFYADDRDFNVDLEFIVPFVRIPIERSLTATKTAFRSLFDLNLNSILTTGAIVGIGGIFAIILKIIFTQFAYVNGYRKSFRNYEAGDEDSNDFTTDYIPKINEFANVMESKLEEKNINISHCIQSFLCNYAQQKFYCNTCNKTHNKCLPQIIDGVLSLDVVLDYLSGTAIKNALDSAKRGDNCFTVYKTCNWSLSSYAILKLLVESFNYIKFT